MSQDGFLEEERSSHEEEVAEPEARFSPLAPPPFTILPSTQPLAAVWFRTLTSHMLTEFIQKASLAVGFSFLEKAVRDDREENLPS